MSQPAAALYIQPPMFETIVATQSIANIRYRNATSGDAPVERFLHGHHAGSTCRRARRPLLGTGDVR